MTLPSELAMNIRIIKALGDSTLEGPVKHFVISSILKKMKKPNIITGDMFWRFLSTYYNITGEISLPEAGEQRDFRLEEHVKLERAAK